jgi:hypothetical protein
MAETAGQDAQKIGPRKLLFRDLSHLPKSVSGYSIDFTIEMKRRSSSSHVRESRSAAKTAAVGAGGRRNIRAGKMPHSRSPLIFGDRSMHLQKFISRSAPPIR